jgi:hypothetical protein
VGYDWRRPAQQYAGGSDILPLMSRGLTPRRRAGAIVAGLIAASAASSAAAQFTSYSRSSHNILEGNWQSCREADGRYSERVYDHIVNGVPKFEVHMGPRREFAIFEGVQDEHRAHDSPANLLKPYRLDLEGNLASHEWKIPSLNLVFTVNLAGGSRGDCESWYILLAPAGKPKPSH